MMSHPDWRKEPPDIVPARAGRVKRWLKMRLGFAPLTGPVERLEAVAHYDISTFNPFNPNPKATVRDGPQTYHEMMNGFVFFVDANEKLGLDIDGKTGRVRARPAAKGAAPR